MLTLENKTRRALSRLINQPLWLQAYLAVLPPDYELSLVLINNKKARELNLTYRGQDYAANVLSFPLGKKVGEIFLNLDQTGHELLFLFIHGLLHLKGMTHGSTMEREEQKILNVLNGKTTNHRARHRHRLGTDRRVRIGSRQ